MPIILVTLLTAILTSCATYQGYETWRKSACDQILDTDEKARCMEDATRPENEYSQDVDAAKAG